MERLRQLLVEDAEGICGQLDKSIQSALGAYRDPWNEVENPVQPAQFATMLGVMTG